eukprot:5805496-Alexandrium_andersonii.AAC.1
MLGGCLAPLLARHGANNNPCCYLIITLFSRGGTTAPGASPGGATAPPDPPAGASGANGLSGGSTAPPDLPDWRLRRAAGA